MELITAIEQSATLVKSRARLSAPPRLALILGSGLGALAEKVRVDAKIAYHDLPGFAAPSVSGHKGELLVGDLNGKKVLVFSGRMHFYEGHEPIRCTLPVRLAARLGAGVMVLTSAVGGINKSYRAGDSVLIKDHMNFMGVNPLRGPHDTQLGARFPDMTECYPADLRALAKKVAKKNKITLREGIYLALSGPSYETPAEIRAFRKWGGDVVGMSLVPEAIVARQAGLKTLGICYISNMAAGVSNKTLNHEEVLEMGLIAGKKLSVLLEDIVREI